MKRTCKNTRTHRRFSGRLTGVGYSGLAFGLSGCGGWI